MSSTTTVASPLAWILGKSEWPLALPSPSLTELLDSHAAAKSARPRGTILHVTRVLLMGATRYTTAGPAVNTHATCVFGISVPRPGRRLFAADADRVLCENAIDAGNGSRYQEQSCPGAVFDES